MQFEIKVRILYAPGNEYCTVEEGVLKVGPLSTECYEEPFNAMDYFYMQSGYLAKNEYTCTIYGSKLIHSSGIAPVDDICALQNSPNIYVDWRGIRRGTEYQAFVYVYLVRDADYQKCIEAVQTIFLKHDIVTHNCDYEEIDNTVTPIKENGCFDFPSPFRPEFVRFEQPAKKYHEFFRDNETELHIFEKYTLNSEKVSWDKELPAEGDCTAWIGLVLALLGILVPLIQGKITQAKVNEEIQFINRCKRKIAKRYTVNGYLFTKAKYQINSKGKLIHVIQEKRGNKVLCEYEIRLPCGQIKRFEFD